MSDSADDSLLRLAVSGNTEALGELLERTALQIRREIRIHNVWMSKLDADDVMQVTFLEAVLYIRRFDPDRSGSFSGWLLRIAENNVRDLTRLLGRQKRPPPERQVHPTPEDSCHELIETLTATSQTPSRTVSLQESRELMELAISRLPRDYRRVVELYDLKSIPIEQVAETLNRSPGAVYMLRARAHDRLREILGSESRYFSKKP